MKFVLIAGQASVINSSFIATATQEQSVSPKMKECAEDVELDLH